MDDDGCPRVRYDRGVGVTSSTWKAPWIARGGGRRVRLDHRPAHPGTTQTPACGRSCCGSTAPGRRGRGLRRGCRHRARAVAASGKRVVAYAADVRRFSGAYAVAVVADEIVLPDRLRGLCQGDRLDGLPVRAECRRRRRRARRDRALRRPTAPAMPIDDAAVARARAIDVLAAVFAAGWPERRSVTPGHRGPAASGTGCAGPSAGLADRVATGAARLRSPGCRRPLTLSHPGAPRRDGRRPCRTPPRGLAPPPAGRPDAAVRTLIGRQRLGHCQCSASLSADLSAANDRAVAAQARVAGSSAAPDRGRQGRWAVVPSPRRLPRVALRRATPGLACERSSVVPVGEVQPPAAPRTATRAACPQSRRAVAKAEPRAGTRSPAAKAAITRHDKALADALRKASA